MCKGKIILHQKKDDTWPNTKGFKVLSFSDLVAGVPSTVSVDDSYWALFSHKKEHPAGRR